MGHRDQIFLRPMPTFDPRQIANLLAWYRADRGTFQDAALTTPAGVGDPVGGMQEFRGNGINLGQIGASRPTLASVTNGSRVFLAMTFDGGDSMIAAAGAYLKNVSGATLIAVLQTADVAGVNYQLIVANGVATNQARAGLERERLADRCIGVIGRRLDADAVVNGSSAANAFTAGTWNAQMAIFDYANAKAYGYLDNALQNTKDPFQTAGATSNTDSTGIGVGALATGGSQMTGQIAEALIYERVLTVTERLQLHRYFQRRYGLA